MLVFFVTVLLNNIQKAFDTVIHPGIKLKLLNIGLGTNFYNIIKSMYAQSKSCIRLKNRVTDLFPTKVGVKQGDNLSPNLFKIFINDLPDYLEKSPDPVLVNSKPVHCLLYADDIVIFSSSEKGLQCKLDQLNNYCKDWCMKINLKKTKVMIFNKAGRHIKHNFYFNDMLIDCVQHCKYLGITFSASGSFSFAQKELYNKALKAYYKLRKDFLSLNPNIKNSLHVFDHTIKPILLYSSEIWGFFNPFKKKLNSQTSTVDQAYPKLLSERLHMKFCKLLLGVGKRATNLATLSELGRFPLHFDITKSMIRYWHRLENLGSSFPLLKDAYLESKLLFESKIPSWYGSLNYLQKKINGVDSLTFASNFRFKILIKKFLYEHYEIQWRNQMHNCADGKLCSYSTFKTHFGLERYLTILQPPEQRRNFTQLRISSHRLRIEQGRYQGTLRQDRICLRCTSNEVDDEKHFLFSCTSSQDKRNYLNSTIDLLCSNFKHLIPSQKLIWLLNVENLDILISVCELIDEDKI